jgi:hypothetical protein
VFRITFKSKSQYANPMYCAHTDCIRLESNHEYYCVFTKGQDLPCTVSKEMWEVFSVQLQE